MKKIIVLLALFVLVFVLFGCPKEDTSSTTKERNMQEQLQVQSVASVGMPNIKNFREKRILKDIYELRDQTGLVTYTYLENEYPQVVPGKTALAGKLTFMGESVGYAIPYATQFTNPQKTEVGYQSITTISQADPNGLFSPTSAEGSWVMMKDPNGSDVRPVYVEMRVLVSQFKFPSD